MGGRRWLELDTGWLIAEFSVAYKVLPTDLQQFWLLVNDFNHSNKAVKVR